MPFTKITEIPLGPMTIKIWGLLVALGMIAGLLLTLKEAKRKRIDTGSVYNLFILIFIMSMIGGRIFYVLLFLPYYIMQPLDIFKIWQGGMVFYGGVLFALLAMLIYLRKKKINFWRFADIAAPGTALGIFIGRIGCFLIGDHIGAKTSLPFGSYYGNEEFLRHEPSLYLSLNGLVLFIVLWLLRKKFKNVGALGALFLIWYSFSRFFLDFTRANDLPAVSDPRFYGLTISQIASIFIFVTVLIWGYKRKLYRYKK